MSTYIRLTNKCTFRSHSATPVKDGFNQDVQPYIQNEAGQWVPNPAYAAIAGDNFTDKVIPCVFLYLATDEKTNPAAEWEDIIEVVIGDTIEPKYSDRIINISDRFGKVIERGPLEVIGIKRYVGFQGELHHYRLRTRRMKDC